MKSKFGNDMTAEIDGGIINIRVGAVIQKDGKLLMVSNADNDYYYSVGGRIKFGETAEQAIEREVFEETGVKLRIDRLGFIHENYFIGDSPAKAGKLIYEISFFFHMTVPDDFEPVCDSFTEDDSKEYLAWVEPSAELKMFPDFFKTADLSENVGVRHFVTDNRPK